MNYSTQESISFLRENDVSPTSETEYRYHDFEEDVTWTGNKVTQEKAGIYKQSIETYEKKKNLKIGEASMYKDDKEGSSGGTHLKSLEYKNRFSGIDLKASGPSIGGDYTLTNDNIGAIGRLNVASVGTNLGGVNLNAGLGFDTGARVGQNGVEARILGTGFSVDKQNGIEVSFLGSSVGIPKFW